jgi:signal transduction histidine kinase
MLNPETALPADKSFMLSSLAPGPAQKRFALAIVLAILAVFLAISFGPFADVHPPRINAFVPAYVMAMFVCDSITAILLYVHFSIARSVSTLVIACGYLFAALILVPFVMVFPDMIFPGNLFGGLQSTSWIWMCQHTGFAAFVLGYALSKDRDDGRLVSPARVRAAIGLSAAGTAAAIAFAAYALIAGDSQLPRVASDSLHFTPLWPYFIGAPVAAMSVSALVALWLRRRSVLDLWLTVVMCLYVVEVPLSYYPDPSRFSVGWYTVRVIGFLSSSLVLIVLLYEISTLYAKLLRAVHAQRREREARLLTGDAVAASIAHEVRQPLTAMVTTADAGWRFLERSEPNLDRAKEAFKRISADGHRAGDVIGNIRANFRSDASDKSELSINELVQEALVLSQVNLEKHSIVVQAETGNELPPVRGNRIQLQQVLLNLIVNAIDAMAARDEPKILAVSSGLIEGDRVMVSVADTGPGIGTEESDRIFSPLFTTKSDGMGMGLAICRSIIEAHEGRLWFAPNVPRGAVFHFTLPCRG